MRPLTMRHLHQHVRAPAPLRFRSSRVTCVTWRGRAIAVALVAAAIAVSAIAPRAYAQKATAPTPQHGKASKAPSGKQADTSRTISTASRSNDSYNVVVPAAVRSAPGTEVIADLHRTANVEVIARDRGWSRVRIEGWVPDSVLTPADTTFRAGLSAADLRADPVSARGKVVQWTVEFLALQTADPLRHGLADGEPYILARGPNSENALLYLVVPPSLMGTARALQPLGKITVTARVRDGRSEPVGIPILDLETIRSVR